MKIEYHYRCREKIFEALSIAFWVWVIIFIFATTFYILQIFFLEPEPGSTYQQDMIKATLCYIFIPLAMGGVVFLASFLALLSISYETKVENSTITLAVKNKISIIPTDFIYSIEFDDITAIKTSFLLNVFKRKQILIKVKKYIENGAPMHANRTFCIIRVCKKEERKHFIEMFEKHKKECLRKENEEFFNE